MPDFAPNLETISNLESSPDLHSSMPNLDLESHEVSKDNYELNSGTQCPLLPISPRTLRLLTSPIKVSSHSIPSPSSLQDPVVPEPHRGPIESPSHIPDMYNVLKHFNIDPDSFNEVDLHSYHSPEVIEDMENSPMPQLGGLLVSQSTSSQENLAEQTISQRIRTLVRHSKIKSYSHFGGED